MAASPSVGTADRERLTMGFRRRLATLRLQAPAPIPGSAPEGDFLEVLSHGAGDAPGILAAIVSLMRAAKPSHAWQVSGALIERPAAPCCGVTIQVSGCPAWRTRRSPCGRARGTRRAVRLPTAPRRRS